MYLKRKIDEYLLEWKQKPDKNPLIIKGARQIGKTNQLIILQKSIMIILCISTLFLNKNIRRF